MGPRRVAATAALAMLLCVPGAPALAHDQDDARSAAKRAADRYVERYGVELAAAEWSARCRRAGQERWVCRVNGGDGECSGTLRLVEAASGSLRRGRTFIVCGSATVQPESTDRRWMPRGRAPSQARFPAHYQGGALWKPGIVLGDGDSAARRRRSRWIQA